MLRTVPRHTCASVENTGVKFVFNMQSANKAFGKDTLTCRRKDVPWKVTCQRLVDHIYAVCAFCSENWTRTIRTLERISMGNQENVTSIPLQKTQKRNVGQPPYKNVQLRNEDISCMKKDATCMWRTMGWAGDENPMQ